MRTVFAFGIVSFLCFSASAAADPAFDTFKASFAADVAKGLKVLDDQKALITDDFMEILEKAYIKQNPAFQPMSAAECEDLRLKIINASPINPFEIRISFKETKVLPFCDQDSDFEDTTFGRVEAPSENRFGIAVATTFARIFEKTKYPTADETERFSTIVYRLSPENEIVEIVSAEAIVTKDAKFPSMKMGLASLDTEGGVYSFRTTEGLSGAVETYLPVEPNAAAIERSAIGLSQKSSLQLETITAYRPELSGTSQGYLVLPYVAQSRQLNEMWLYTDNAYNFYSRTNTYATMETKKLNGREICTFGRHIHDFKAGTITGFPADSNDLDYCEGLR